MKKLQLVFIFLLLTVIGFGKVNSNSPSTTTHDPALSSVAGISAAIMDNAGVLGDPSLTGPTSVCLNVTGNVYTTEAGQTGYVWTVSGGTITSGGNSTSNTATITWTSVGSKTISVSYSGSTTTVLPVTVNPLTSISIVASANNVAPNTSVTYTATANNPGPAISYQWKVNGANVGTNSSTYSYIPSNGDAIFCLLTSNGPCFNTTFTSNVITMVVVAKPMIVTVPTINAIPGQVVSFPVKLIGASAAGTPISGAEILITYDPAVLQYDTLVNFYAGMPSAQWYFSGNFNAVAANWSEPSLLTMAIPDNTTLFEIQFTYIGGTGTLPFVNYNFTDALYNLITVDHVDGGISPVTAQFPGYLACDFHQHTTYTDGSYSFSYVMKKNNSYGLNMWANSEHGGAFNRNATISGLDLGSTVYWDSYVPNPIIGTVSMSGGHQNMWRWQSLRDYSFANVQIFRALFPSKMILQSYELNVPGHEHASLGLINNQFDALPNCNPLAEFEFKFDASDADVTGGVAQGWTKSTLTNVHAKAVEAVTWLQTNYPATSYMIAAHPERKSLNNIQGFRDMNTAAPSVCFGFESMPGHQKASNRGEYGGSNNTAGSSTYGGCGVYAAKIGGLWDAMLSEGRHWWLFASSDYHANEADFFPGEYQKTFVHVSDRNNAQSYIDGLRSGNSYVVEGDLIDSLDFKVGTTPAMTEYATMGQVLNTMQSSVSLKIRVSDPQGTNYNTYGPYNNPDLNHIDLIKGKVGSMISPSSPSYSLDTVATTAIIARFDAVGGVISPNGVVSQAWTDLGGGVKEITFTYNNLVDSVYFRLRGTNQGLGVANETDANGNPLSDALMAPNNAVKAFNDLWFYSNPIFVAGPISAELSGPTTVCEGAAGNVYTTNAGMSNYSWSVSGGTITAGGTSSDNTATVTWNTPGTQSISVSYTGSLTTTLPVVVNPTLPVSVSISASANPVCANTSVTFTATPVNGGSTPAFQWKKGGSVIAGATNATYTYNPVNNDAITCILTSNASPCTTGSPATSNAITMTVYPLTASISIAASANPVMAGTAVTFTATAVNGGTTPGFQWKVNGANVGTGGSTYTFTPAHGDVVYCILTSSAPCVTALFTSNLITMTVIYPAGSLLVTLPAKTAMPGDILYFPVKLKGASSSGTPISAAELQIAYDPAILQFNDLVNFYAGMPSAQWYFSGNFDTVAANWQEPGLNAVAIPDSTTLFEIQFTYLGGTGLLPVSLANFTNASFDLIPTNKVNGGVSQLVPTNNSVQNTTVANGQTQCFNAIQTLTVAGSGTTVTVENGASATFIAGQKISFLPGAAVLNGGYMHGYITTSAQYCGMMDEPLVSAKVNADQASFVNEMTTTPVIRLYPNPVTSAFTVEVQNDAVASITKVELYSINGLKVASRNADNVKKQVVSVANLTPGMYFVHVFTNRGSEILKIVKL